MRRKDIPYSERYSQLLNIAETVEGDEAIAAFMLAKRLLARHGHAFSNFILPVDSWTSYAEPEAHERLCKVLRLMDSDREGESIAAFLMALRQMKRLGLRFRDITPEPQSPREQAAQKVFTSDEIEIRSLRNRLRIMQAKIIVQNMELAHYRAAFDELMDASLSMHQSIEYKPIRATALMLN